jgi:outer membrane protein assembly factor BamB
MFVANLQAAADPDSVVLDSGDAAGEQGWSVDVSGDLAIVGAPFYNGGHAFIFDVNSGQLLHRLTPEDPSANALFGFSVAIDDGLAVVASGQRNAAYIFDANTGQQLRKLTPISNANHFVRSVDISNGVAVLGVPQAPSSGPFPRDAGAAFVYEALSGNLLHRFNGPTTFAKRQFGSRVEIEGQTLAISSPSSFTRHDVQVFDALTGQFQWSYGYATTGQQLEVKDIAIDDGFVVVGAGGFGFDMPTAIVLDRVTGTELHRIDTRVPNLNDEYKSQLDVSGNRLVVGSWGTYYAEHGGYYVGDVHIFDVLSGDYVGGVANPFPTSLDNFGYSVAVEGNRLIVGAPAEDSGRGLAYSFVLVPEPATASLTLISVVACIPLRLRRDGRHADLSP